MAGGVGSPTYGSWKNWIVALFTLVVVTFFTNFGKGLLRLASILVGILAGYILALAMGMVQFDNVMTAGYFEMPQVLHFGLEFDPLPASPFPCSSSSTPSRLSVTSRPPLPEHEPSATSDELHGAILGLGATNILGAFFGFLRRRPSARMSASSRRRRSSTGLRWPWRLSSSSSPV